MRCEVNWALLPLFLMVGCQNVPTDPDDKGISVETEKTLYQEGQRVKYTIRNDSASPAFLMFCGGLTLTADRKTEDGWEGYWVAFCLAIFAPYTEALEPGQTYTSSVPFRDTGTFRYVVPYCRSSNCAEIDSVLSNAFVVQ